MPQMCPSLPRAPSERFAKNGLSVVQSKERENGDPFVVPGLPGQAACNRAHLAWSNHTAPPQCNQMCFYHLQRQAPAHAPTHHEVGAPAQNCWLAVGLPAIAASTACMTAAGTTRSCWGCWGRCGSTWCGWGRVYACSGGCCCGTRGTCCCCSRLLLRRAAPPLAAGGRLPGSAPWRARSMAPGGACW